MKKLLAILSLVLIFAACEKEQINPTGQPPIEDTLTCWEVQDQSDGDTVVAPSEFNFSYTNQTALRDDSVKRQWIGDCCVFSISADLSIHNYHGSYPFYLITEAWFYEKSTNKLINLLVDNTLCLTYHQSDTTLLHRAIDYYFTEPYRGGGVPDSCDAIIKVRQTLVNNDGDTLVGHIVQFEF